MNNTTVYLAGKGPSLDRFDWEAAEPPAKVPRYAINEACLVVPFSIGVAQDEDVWRRIGSATTYAEGARILFVPAAGMHTAVGLCPTSVLLPTNHGWPLYKRYTAEVALRVIRTLHPEGDVTVRLVGFDNFYDPLAARVYAESVKARSFPWNIEKSGVSHSPIETINAGIRTAAEECGLVLVNASAAPMPT